MCREIGKSDCKCWINLLKMQEKKPFALRLSKDMMLEIERWSYEEFRSVNGQIEYILSEEIKNKRKKKNKNAN